jgi:hypothetical protein
VALVEDNGPIHTSKRALAALAARAHWLTVEWLPKYAPELNDIETVWRDLKAHHLAHQTFADADALDQAIHQAVAALNDERMAHPLAKPRISAWLACTPYWLEISAIVPSSRCFCLIFVTVTPWLYASLGAGLYLSHLSSCRGPPQSRGQIC